MAAKLRVNVWVFGFLSVACGSGDDVSNLGGSPTAAGNSSGKPLGGGQGSGIVAPTGAAKGTAAATKEELAAPGATNNCGVKNYDLKAQPAELLLVLDRSGSMAESFTTMAGGRARGQKWTEVTGALDQVIMRTQAGVFWGLKLYPVPNSCGVPDGVTVPTAPNNYGPVMMAIRAAPAVQNGGATPTQAAMRNATKTMSALQSPNPKYLVLATDGLPNCSNGQTASSATDVQGAIASVADAAAAGLPTFVVGIAVDNQTTNTLNEMATKGGRPRINAPTKFYPVQSREEFAAALEQITGQIASCTFPLNPPPPVPGNVAVEVDGARVGKDATQAEGWNYNGQNASLTIYGGWCEKLKNGSAKKVNILYGCPGVNIP